MNSLLKEIRTCRICESHLPLGCNPVVTASPKSKIIIVGQAPGRKVHESGIPWDDKSGDNLRSWLGVTTEQFYNSSLFALMPMGFCYPGTGKSGDLPPRTECAPLWHQRILDYIKNVELVLLVGNYAQKYYLRNSTKSTLTKTVQNYKEYLPDFLPLPHPSPRNNIWQKKNPWFMEEIIPELRERVSTCLDK